MKFQISRTSASVVPPIPAPHPRAQRESIGGRWEWTIEVASLEDLLTLAPENSEGVIVSHGEPLPGLEIYDEYRE